MWKSTVWITGWSLANIVLAFILQVTLAAQFGASQEMDVYLAATTLTTLLIGLLPTALSISLIPIFVEYKTNQKENHAFAITNSVMVWAAFLLGVMIILGWFLSDWIMSAIVPGFSKDNLEFSTNLFRIVLPSIFFFGLAHILGSSFYARRRPFWPAVTPIYRILGMLLGVLIWRSHGVVALVWGDVVGSAVGLFVLLIIYSIQGHYRHWNGLWNDGVRKVVIMLVPWLIAFSVARANPIIERFFASSMPEGSITHLGYAWMIVYLFTTFVSKGLNLSLFPILSKMVTEGNLERLRHVIARGIHGLLTFMLPVVALIWLFGQFAIALIFERGFFDASATNGTFIALLGYSGALLALPMGIVVTNTFYAMQDTKSVAIVSIMGLCVMVIIDFVLVRYLGVLSLSIGYSVGAIFNLLIFIVLLSKRLNGIPFRYNDLAGVIIGVILATAFVSIIRSVRIMRYGDFPNVVNMTTFLILGAELLIFVVVYLGLTYIMRNTEIRSFWFNVKRKTIIAKNT